MYPEFVPVAFTEHHIAGFMKAHFFCHSSLVQLGYFCQQDRLTHSMRHSQANVHALQRSYLLARCHFFTPIKEAGADKTSSNKTNDVVSADT